MKAKPLKTLFKITLTFFMLIVIFSCQNTSKHNESVMLEEVEVAQDFESVSNQDSEKALKVGATTSSIPKNLKIIKSAKAKYKVKHVKKATNEIKQVAIKYGAYISDMRFENNLYQKANRFTIKIPQQHFDSFMDSISGVAEFIDYENITTQDVTEEYIDLQSRLNTKLEVKKRYESILRKKAITVEDILNTEDKIRIIQEEIEAAQGRLKYLSNKVSFSTIQIDLYETVDYKEEPVTYNKTFWTKSKNALSFGWELIENLLLGILHIWPLIITGTLLIIYIRKRLLLKK
ncbi:DUF4349 domain-containing protein [Seonamhaeicola maritimus]|uniref:DUF4349 domain-containing protein n=1 Tax=Seonamhaeicola maritimus TaxID=2591822 RepID=A0A5C7GEB1_9FLAO|nr:DUF4349 domain-containing protein [Seonamhaeicola maritimus]TXG35271.1 DUF4349 domain-containing protein [Seonamhaeicola maritimus]